MTDLAPPLDEAAIRRTKAALHACADWLTDIVDDQVVAAALIYTFLDFASPRWGDPAIFERLTVLRREFGQHLERAGFVIPADLR